MDWLLLLILLVLLLSFFLENSNLFFMIQNISIGNFRVTNLSELKMVSCNWWANLTVHSAAFRAGSWIYNTEIWLWRLFPTLCLPILVAIKSPAVLFSKLLPVCMSVMYLISKILTMLIILLWTLINMTFSGLRGDDLRGEWSQVKRTLQGPR